MKKSFEHIILTLLLFVGWISYAQDFTTKIEGRVFSKDGDVSAIHISNVTRNRGTITDLGGFFTISVRLNDTLVFSAVQYKKKYMVITADIIKNKKIQVFLEEALTELNEVVVTPYNLTWDIKRDAARLQVGQVITASTLGLPNAYVKVKTQNERKLAEADSGKFIEGASYKLDSTFNPMIVINLHKILNRLSGRTQKLKAYVAIDKEISLLQEVKKSYHDSIYEQELKIPNENIDDFMNFCEIDSLYNEVVASKDILQLWEFLKRNSITYRQNNGLE